jgi:stage II sporulation protein D
MLFFICLNSIEIYAVTIPKNVRIGLFYNSQSKNSLEVSSDDGFLLGYYRNRDFIKLFNIKEKFITIRKDSCFARKDYNFFEFEPNDVGSISGKKCGPYHLQYYHDLTLDESLEKVKELETKQIKSYIACIGLTLNVWGGNFVNLDDAKSAANNSKIPAVVREISDKRIQVVDNKSLETIFLFGHNEFGLGIKPIVKENEEEKFAIYPQNSPIYFRGGLDFRRINGENMTVVNVLGMEEYLYGTINREMISTWPNEALKAQAVASRTYATKNLNRYSEFGFDMNCSTDCQVYTGMDYERKNSIKAVNETKGKVLMYGNQLISAVFSMCMGPYTEDAENVWGFHCPYLVSVNNSFEQIENIPGFFWEKSIAAEKATIIMKEKGYDLGEIENVEVLEVSRAGSVLKLKVSGTSGEKIFLRERTRLIFGDITRSQMFNVKKIVDEDEKVSFLFSGFGWGHGVGMSQYGAKSMAEKGFTFDKILKHYYTGVEIMDVYKY